MTPAKQHGLVQQRDPRAAQLRAGGAHLAVDLVRVIGVQHEDGGPLDAAQPGKQAVIHARRQHDGLARVHADAPHVRDAGDRIGDLCQARVTQRQRIATAQDDFLDARVRGDRVQRGAESRGALFRGLSLSRIRELAPETVAAMDGAGLGRDEQRASRVFLQQPGRARRIRVRASGSAPYPGVSSSSSASGSTWRSNGSFASPRRMRAR